MIGDEDMFDVHLHKIPNIPEAAYYIPNFISEIEESDVIKRVNGVPVPKWTQLSNRRLQNWGGIPHPKGMIAEEIPSWLTKYILKIKSLNFYDEDKTPNHVLINEYLSGQGIMAHSDGPLFHPIVTTITCGSHTILEFYKRLDTQQEQQQDLEFSLLLEPRSLFVLTEDLYHNYMHCIREVKVDTISKDIKNIDLCDKKYKIGETLERGTRLSLTIRHVPKTSKLKLRLGK